jgi:hypothetical protein
VGNSVQETLALMTMCGTTTQVENDAPRGVALELGFQIPDTEGTPCYIWVTGSLLRSDWDCPSATPYQAPAEVVSKQDSQAYKQEPQSAQEQATQTLPG